MRPSAPHTPQNGEPDVSQTQAVHGRRHKKTGRILIRTASMSGFMVIFTVAIFLSTTLPNQRRRLIEEMHQRAQVVQTSTVQILEESIALDDNSAVVDHCISIVSQTPSLHYVIITPKDGPSLIHTQQGWRQEDLGGMWKPADLPQPSRGRFMINPLGDGGELFHISYPFDYLGLDWGWIHLGLSIDKFRADSRLLYRRSGIIALAAISVGMLFSLYFARRISVPILKLERFARQVASGDLSHRIDILTGDEIEHLGKALNYMVEQLQQANREREKAQKTLISAARQAGMAEMVSNVLHNVGNVLNSVGVTTSNIQRRLVKSKTENLVHLADLIENQGDRLSTYLTTDPRGIKIPDYLVSLSRHLADEKAHMMKSVTALERHIEHVRDIIHLQQDYSRTRGLTESVAIAEIIEDALTLNTEPNAKYGIKVQKEFEPLSLCLIDRHRLLQILINLISNARHAMIISENRPRVIHVTLERHQADRIQIRITDNGVGIAAKNLTRIFQHGFTTRKEGHGFGLHSSAIAARELSGTLTVTSGGNECGATFIIDLPYRPVGGTNAP
ncbi:MAG: HAMP domain-containing histidine kinase [Desulfatitalea sp.]|nr:HAMP domain-containing histidine kinase [Desulfatitalea sp.]NNK00703.1 HAMP domain-containing histidine kinase [Desulfatitalea sp.]